MRQLGTLITVLCLMLVALPAMAAELVDNPEYQSWARHKPGSSATFAYDITVGKIDIKLEITQSLKELTAETAVIEMVGRDLTIPKDHPTRKTIEIAAKVPRKESETVRTLPGGFTGDAKPLGKQTIQLAGTVVETQVCRFDGKNARGMQTEGKTWVSLDVPGCIAKMELTCAGENEHAAMSLTMTLSKLDEAK